MTKHFKEKKEVEAIETVFTPRETPQTRYEFTILNAFGY